MAPHNKKGKPGYTNPEDKSLKANQKLCNPPEGEDIVISGMAGLFPSSDDVYHFRDNLFNKVDMVTGDYRRWEPIHPEVPQRTGKINHPAKFDTGFFGIGKGQVNTTDPMARLILEKAFEAIIDAGYNPSEIAGTRTGVFVGACSSESERANIFIKRRKRGYSMIGSLRSMVAQHISYFFKLQGPSCSTDSACSSSMCALEYAYKSLSLGHCEMAIVGGVSLCLHPIVSLQFARLGILSADGTCKVFDNAANGYVRSDGIVALFLQKSKYARRTYANILHTKINCDGFKQQGITYPSSEMQKVLMREIYQERGMEPSAVTFVEAHGTGTKVGDPEELNSLDDVFCTGRDRPLYIGSLKSNIGHSEAVSCACSIVKVLIGMESGFIPPNINFSIPREGVEALENGRLKVVVKKMSWPDNNGIVGINSFGFGGANGHILLQWNQKIKCNGGTPEDDLLRLVCVSGRTEEAVAAILDEVQKNTVDAEFVKLLHTVFGKEIIGHPYCGYSIISKTGELQRSTNNSGVSKKKKLWIFNNFDRKWPKLGQYLLVFPIFERTLQQIRNVLLGEVKIDILELIKKFDQDNIMCQVMCTMAVQICLAEILKELGVVGDFVVGFGTGELVAAYLDEWLTLREVILAHICVGFVFSKEGINEVDSDSCTCRELINNLQKIITKRNVQFKRWLPLYHKSQNISFYTQGSAKYFAQNILSPIKFQEIQLSLPNEHLLFFGLKPNNLESQNSIALVEGSSEDYTVNFLSTLGRLYENGYQMQLDRLYPNIPWPVSRGTSMLSPLIKWVHDDDWFVTRYKYEDEVRSGQRVVHITVKEDDWNFVTGHVIDGRNLFPATGYLMIVWETLARNVKKLPEDMVVVFEDVKFIRATNLPKKGALDIKVAVQTGDKNFEILEGESIIVTGKVYEMDDKDYQMADALASTNGVDEEEPLLTEKEIYKEFRLRGYNYKDLFRSLKECDVTCTKGLITWRDNWIVFMDNMLQIHILKEDTKNLYVPTGIQRLTVNGPSHMKYVRTLEEKGLNIPVYVFKELGVVRSGGIEIRGLKANAIPRKKHGIPVLETYKFVPNKTTLPVSKSVRVMMQIILENSLITKVKTVEVLDPAKSDLLSPLIQQILGDMPLIQAEIIVLSKKSTKISGITVEDRLLSSETNALVAVASNVCQNIQMLNEALKAIKDTNGFIISREGIDFDASKLIHCGLDYLCTHTNDSETLVLLSKTTELKQPIVIDICHSLNDLSWIAAAQNAIKESQKLVMVSQNRFVNGILGLINCLRREPNGSKIACFFVIDDAPIFDLNDPFYKSQLRQNLAINIWKDGAWGTYRHLLMEQSSNIQSEHCYVNTTVRGDLSSLRWIEGPLNGNGACEPGKELIHVYCSALNFRDIMIASGRLSLDVVTTSRIEQECVQGFEYSGRNSNGIRVMGTVLSGAFSTLVLGDSYMLWHVPDEWSMEEAATVPVAYSTVIYALVMRANIKPGQSILIHSATGGVGQAAINIALHFGCDIFVTVGTREKRNFLISKYPQIKESHIGNSRDTSFEEMIKVETKGRGVDMVLNSLAEEKLLASVRCLAVGGHFLEIGKFDIANNNELRMEMFGKQGSFHGVMLDGLILGSIGLKQELSRYVFDLIRSGAVKPLPMTVFMKDEIVEAFKYMVAAKHTGKVLIRVRTEERDRICPVSRTVFQGIPRFFCNAENTYIILGGLGGFGLQLADWLVVRGARNLVLTSRTGIRNGYQARMVRLWKSYNTRVVIRTDDITTSEGCTKLVNYSNSLGPIKGMFNLAVVLRDGLFENQTVDDYQASLAPKAIATIHLDAITRKMCPELSHFVAFSSVSCGRGNAGQTNYGMANSIMERICEQRRRDGYPGLAIQWGAIGDVGLVADMADSDIELVIGGTLQQKISSCLQVMDDFLRQDEPIVASMVVAEKRSSATEADNIVDAIANIIGIVDLKTVSHHSTLPELGMDSMMGVEIKQTLEREYEVFLSAQDIRSMTFARLEEIAVEKLGDQCTEPSFAAVEDLSVDFRILLQHIGYESSANLPLVKMQTAVDEDKIAPKIFMLPGIEGAYVPMKPLAKNLKAHVTCLQYCSNSNALTIEDMANDSFPYVDAIPSSFVLVAHSYGCVLATELARLLEASGRRGKLVFIDGSVEVMAELVRKQFEVDTQELFETSVVCTIMTRYLPITAVMKHKPDILKCATLEDRIKFGLSILPNLEHSPEYITNVCTQICRRVRSVLEYVPHFGKLKSAVKLIKPKEPLVVGFADDYKLAELFEQPVDVGMFEGNHLTILDNPDVAREIDRFIKGDEVAKTNFAGSIEEIKKAQRV